MEPRKAGILPQPFEADSFRSRSVSRDSSADVSDIGAAGVMDGFAAIGVAAGHSSDLFLTSAGGIAGAAIGVAVAYAAGGAPGQIYISSHNADRSAAFIRNSELIPIAKLRALETLREARATKRPLAEEVDVAGDGGLVIELRGMGDRELMITISTTGSWTYFSGAVSNKQIAAGILRDDGIKTAVRWVAGLENDLVGPGVIAG